MLVDGHFAVERETFHRGAFENGGVAVLDVVEDPRLADEISGVDPVSVAVVFLEEGFDAVVSSLILSTPNLLRGLVPRTVSQEPERSWKAISSEMSASVTPSP